MFLDAPNPTQLQFVPPRKRANPPPPLILIHDGGGTTFSYFLLGNLHRDVWAIHNPKHGDDSVWEGGIDGMAKHYISLILKAGITGSVVFGGLSALFCRPFITPCSLTFSFPLPLKNVQQMMSLL